MPGDQRGGIGRFHAGVAAAFAQCFREALSSTITVARRFVMAMLAFRVTHRSTVSTGGAMRRCELDASHLY